LRNMVFFSCSPNAKIWFGKTNEGKDALFSCCGDLRTYYKILKEQIIEELKKEVSQKVMDLGEFVRDLGKKE